MPSPSRQILVPFRSASRLARFPEARALVGRARDLGRVTELVRGAERLVTILGPPGIGKTSLATAAAEQLQGSLPGWFCDLSNQRTETELCAQVMSLFGKSGESAAEVEECLAALGPALIVLDNFEQLVEFASIISRWSSAAPDVAFVVTSRERLAIDRECVVELDALEVPEAGALEERVRASEAVELFRQRAFDAGGNATEDLDAIAEIVRHLDGIPLAIELAAARTRILSPRELAKRLRGGDDVLAFRKRSPARHQTLADAIEWSWELLSQREQSALATCAVFAGSFSVAACESVLSAALGRGESIELIAALRDKSLVHVASQERLGLYMSIRQFAARKLASDPALRARAEAGHAQVFATIAEEFARSRFLTTSSSASNPHGRIWQDADNLIAALTYLGTGESGDPAVERRGQRAEIAATLTLLGVSSVAIWECLGEACRDGELPAVSRAVAGLARHLSLALRGEFDEALLDAQRVVDDPAVPQATRAAALVRLGISRRAAGDAPGALRAHEAAAALIGTERTNLRAMNVACTGRLMCDLHDLPAARRLNDEAAALCEEIGEPWLAALGPANLAQLAQEHGELERAEALLEDAIARFREAGEPVYVVSYAAICGGLYLEWGRHEAARRWYQATEGVAAGLLQGVLRVALHGGWAAVEAHEGDEGAARQQLDLARRSVLRCPTRLSEVTLEIFAAVVELELGRASSEQVRAFRERQRELCAALTLDAIKVQQHVDARFALRMLTRALEAQAPDVVLRVNQDGSAFCVAGAEEVSLDRRRSLRGIVCALVEARIARPGQPLDSDALFARGWPGQHIRPESASTRVRVAIATLRKMGLRDVLVTHDDGYLLDPEARMEME